MTRGRGESSGPPNLGEEDRKDWKQAVHGVRPIRNESDSAVKPKRKPKDRDKPVPLRPSEEDLRSWRESVADVAPLPPRDTVVPPEKPPHTSRRRRQEDLPPAPPDASPLPKMTKGEFARIADGRHIPTAILDMHGMTQDQAFDALNTFLARAYAEGHHIVKAITGRGTEGAGVLRQQFPHWLENESLRGYVRSYHEAAPRHGGDGAWYVRIRHDTELT